MSTDSSAPDGAENSTAVDERVILVPYRWWRESQESPEEMKGISLTVSPAPSSYTKLIGSILNSDLVFSIKRNDEVPMQAADAVEESPGRCYALIPSNMWSQALKRHNDSSSVVNGWSSFAEEGLVDVYPLMLRISVMPDTSIMTVKITKKENAVENYKRALKIFGVDSEVVQIWDFSGRTNLIFMREWNRMPQDGQLQSGQEIILELHVSAFSETMTCKSEVRKDDPVAPQPKTTTNPYGSSLRSNGNVGNMDSDLRISGNFKGIGLGLIGLENLGNTCFMNSAIQCLAHTPKLVEFFLRDYSGEINHHNPLGMDGEIALAFGELLRKLWAPDKTPVVPRVFKSKLGRFAPQFSGFNQHDSQEVLAFLLDGLHEDLNRVKHKPYIEVKDAADHPDEEIADEYWANHLARNDSIIVDTCQGQYRSKLVCPVCNKVSVTFDPFMYLSLPLPSSSSMRTMTITVCSTDGSRAPSPYTINVPKNGKCKDLVQALSFACSLGDDEYLLVAEVYSGRIIRYLEDYSDLLSLLRDGDRLVAYRLLKDQEKLALVVFTHQQMEEHYMKSIMASRWKAFGVPVIARLRSTCTGSSIRNIFLKLVNPFLKSTEIASDNEEKTISVLNEATDMDISSHVPNSDGISVTSEEAKEAGDDFLFYLTDEKSQVMQSKIEMDDSISITGSEKQLHILVSWQNKALIEYDISLLSSLPEIYKSTLFARRPQETVSLYACLGAFLKEEPLGPEDMWYCPICKKHQQASKKLDLWRLPEVLVIHLKRFSYSRFMKNKLETLVDFPIHDLDLSSYISHRTEQPCHRYSLYAISNHYGGMGGGHYTAYAYHEGENRWYDFDDRHVLPLSDDSIKTSAAYVLFYRRVQGKNSHA